MKTLDIIAALLLVVGGLNWGLVGTANVDLVLALFGAGSILAKVVYTLVGVAAVYQTASLRAVQRRWHVQAVTA